MAQHFESGFKTTLALKLLPADTSMTVATAPTITAGRVFLDNGAQQEWVKFTGVSGVVLIGLTRNLSLTADPATGGTGKTWIAGSTLKIVQMHDQMRDPVETETITGIKTFTNATFSGANNGGTGLMTFAGANAGVILTGAKKGFGLPSLTTTEREALTPVNGYMVYDTTIGVNYQYIGGTWTTFASGAVVNASETVAGKVQLTNPATGSDVGSSGAALVLISSDLSDRVRLTAGEDITIGDNLCFGNTSDSETQTQTKTGTDYAFGKATFGGNIGQLLTLSTVGYIQRVATVKFDLKKAGSPTGNVFVSIFNDDKVTVVENSDNLDGATLTTSYATKTFTFSTNNLIPGKTYYYILRRSNQGSDTDYYRADGGAAAGYVAITFDADDWTTQTYGLKSESSITTYAVNPASVMKMDANDPLKIQDAGIATETKTTGQTIKVQMSGIVAGLSGFTPNLYYYASDTAGALSTTPSTTYNIRIGKAISATQLLIDKKKIYNTLRTFVRADCQYNNYTSADYNALYSNKYIRIYTGFRPTIIRTRFFTTGAVLCSGTGYVDGAVNRGYYNSVTANTICTALTATSYYIITSATGTITGIVNFLNNGFELYYSKATNEVFTNVGNLSFDVE